MTAFQKYMEVHNESVSELVTLGQTKKKGIPADPPPAKRSLLKTAYCLWPK